MKGKASNGGLATETEEVSHSKREMAHIAGQEEEVRLLGSQLQSAPGGKKKKKKKKNSH